MAGVPSSLVRKWRGALQHEIHEAALSRRSGVAGVGEQVTSSYPFRTRVSQRINGGRAKHFAGEVVEIRDVRVQ